MVEILYSFKDGDSVFTVIKCDCNKTKKVRLGNLLKGDVKSCGKCFILQKFKDSKRKNNRSEYSVWLGMKKRCYNKNEPCYHHYGGRGISVCQRWLNSFDNFLHDMGKKPSENHSIDRINVNGNYDPLNCRWATAKEQSRNTRKSIMIKKPNEEVVNIAVICDEYGVSIGKARRRIRTGFDPFLSCTVDSHNELLKLSNVKSCVWDKELIK
jgi:hypothetical protein